MRDVSEGYTTNARILIVEDEAIVAMDIRHRLEKLGYVPVRSVASGEEAVEAAAELDPDLILMDIQLAGAMDGIEAAGFIRERGGTPVIFLTAYSDRASLERAKVADAFGYVLKPFEERELGIAIEMALYKEQMQRRLSESREWLYGTVGALYEGVVTTDAEGTVLFMNRRAEELLGWSEADAVGLHVEAVVRTEPIPSTEFATEILPEAVRLLRRDGSVAYVERRTGEIPEPAKRPGKDTQAAPTATATTPAASSRHDDSPPAVCGRVVVLREVSDILRYDHAMRAARTEAERALKTKSEFLANVTHELRTPLNSILGMADLAHELARDDQQREYLGILKSSAENLHGLISSILDLSRIDSGHLQLEPAEVDLDQVLESVVESFALEAHRKGLALHFAQSPETPAYVMADRVRLVQVLSNLIANAVKYTGAGSVTVSAEAGAAVDAAAAAEAGAAGAAGGAGGVEARLVRIAVSDTGPGIPESEQQRVFEPFTQVDGGPTRAFNGAGIGLAVAREIVELMGGRIRLESAAGQGSVFTVELPLVLARRTRKTAGMLPEPRTIVLVGPPNPSRLALEAWGREVGAVVETADGPAAVDSACAVQPDIVLLLDDEVRGDEGDDLLRMLGEKCTGAELWVARRIGAPGDVGRRLSQPVMPSTLLRLLAGVAEHATSAPAAAEGDVADEAILDLLHRFPASDLNEERLPALAAAAGKVRADGEGGSARADEVLFRVSLAARRGDLETARERVSELGQMRLNQYNDER